MKLIVTNPFRGKVEGRILNVGEVITSNDVDRINTLIQRGKCKILSLECDPLGETKPSGITFQEAEYDLGTMKEALKEIGVAVAANAKATGINNALSKLTEDQINALAEILNGNKEE